MEARPGRTSKAEQEHLFAGVSFSDANTATVVGDSGIILHTTDGGTEWYRQVSGTSGRLRAVCFIDPDTGTTVGWRTILRTTNGGVTWTSQLSDANSSFRGVSFTDANSGIAVEISASVPPMEASLGRSGARQKDGDLAMLAFLRERIREW